MKIVFFGGAFDPFHSQHEAAIRAAQEVLKPNLVVLVPTLNPPHKDNSATGFEDRAAMLRLWTNGKSGIVVDTIEAQTGNSQNCSYQIIALLKEKYKASQYYYLIGGDSMVNFYSWVKPELIARQAILAVFAREGFGGIDAAISGAKAKYGASIIKLDTVGKEVSSGELKAMLELKMDVSQHIDGRITDYIAQAGLYQNYYDIIDLLKNSVSEDLFGHCARTALFAVRYSTQAKVSYHKAFLAGLLHDCAKEQNSDTTGYPTQVRQVVHQYKGAEAARRVFGIDDGEILDAIACHTTGKPDMSPLARLIYLADKLEDGRQFEGIQPLRQLLKSDFDKAFITLVRHNADYLHSHNIKADGLTNECINYYTNNKY